MPSASQGYISACFYCNCTIVYRPRQLASLHRPLERSLIEWAGQSRGTLKVSHAISDCGCSEDLRCHVLLLRCHVLLSAPEAIRNTLHYVVAVWRGGWIETVRLRILLLLFWRVRSLISLELLPVIQQYAQVDGCIVIGVCVNLLYIFIFNNNNGNSINSFYCSLSVESR